MTIVFAIVLIAVIAAVSMLAVGRLGELPQATVDRRPEGTEPQFDVVLRGYRMDEVDETIAALQQRIDTLEGR